MSDGDSMDQLKKKLAESEAECARLRTTVSELEENAYGQEALEEEVEELKGKLEEALKLTPEGAAKRIAALEDEVLAKSKEVVAQGERNLQLQQDASQTKRDYAALRADASKVRAALVSSIAGPKAYVKNFQNVSLDEMFRIHAKQAKGGGKRRGGAPSPASRPGSRASRSSRKSAESGGAGAGAGAGTGDDSGSVEGGDEAGSGGGPEPLHQVLAAEREIQTLKTRNRKLHDQVERLQGELHAASTVARNVHQAKGKLSDMAQRARAEKANRLRAEQEVQRGMEKVEALMEHIEKLMVHLKHEAAAKAKAYEAQRRAEKDIQLLKNRNAVLVKKNQSRDRLINELKEGSKILEDQLRLMDEKYIELRNKLDWTRQHSQKEVRRIQKQATRLRAQVMMSRTASDVGAAPLPSRGGHSRGPATSHPGTAPSGSQRRAANGGGGGMGESASLRDVRTITMPLDPAEDADPSLPWSNTRLSKTYGMS